VSDQTESSPARVAFDLVQLCIEREGPGSFPTRQEVLDLYDECYYAASGQRGLKSRHESRGR